MKAKVLIAAVAGLAGLVASADVLYWQVNNEAADASLASGDTYAYALLRARDASGENQYWVNENVSASGATLGGAVAKSVFSDSSAFVGGVMDASKILSFSSGSAYSGQLSDLYFFLELYDSAGKSVAVTPTAQAYDTLVNQGTISGFNANFTGVNAALGGGATVYGAVPEPTSGLLMLIGVGALALRRRRIA